MDAFKFLSEFCKKFLKKLTSKTTGLGAEGSGDFLEKKIDKVVDSEVGKFLASPASCSDGVSSAATTADTTSAASGSTGDAVDFSRLNWCWGGLKGGSAALAGDSVISNLSVGSSITYKWEAGGCEALGASNAGDYSKTVCCLFCQDGAGDWSGGKFDWISTSRTSRDIANIKDGYNGWNYSAFLTATGYAFCIVSADGKRRTNVIYAKR